MSNKKTPLVGIILLAVGILFYWFVNSQSELIEKDIQTRLTESQEKEQKENEIEELINEKVPKTKEELSDILSPCLQDLNDQQKGIFNNYQFAYGLKDRGLIGPRYQNVHLIDESGDVMRLRYFYQDTEEGEIPKMIVYRENEEGFPELLEENDSHNFLNNRGGVEKWLENSEVLYIEEGISIVNDKGQDIFAIVEKNAEEGDEFILTRIDINDKSCQ